MNKTVAIRSGGSALRACMAGALLAWNAAGVAGTPDPGVRPHISAVAPHDPEAFTQGLLADADVWLESLGLYGRSELREVDRRTGRVRRRVPLDRRFFGEGLALWRGHLYQLTWREGICLVYDRETFELQRQFTYPGEGWGLTADENHLYMSDGSATIRVLAPETFTEIRSMEVRGHDGPVRLLNELERVNGEIWANIFQSKRIVRFNPADGRVLGFLDLSHLPLAEDAHPGQDVLNGIAADPDGTSVWVTGKNWKRLYRLEWPPAAPPAPGSPVPGACRPQGCPRDPTGESRFLPR